MNCGQSVRVLGNIHTGPHRLPYLELCVPSLEQVERRTSRIKGPEVSHELDWIYVVPGAHTCVAVTCLGPHMLHSDVPGLSLMESMEPSKLGTWGAWTALSLGTEKAQWCLPCPDQCQGPGPTGF